MLTRFSFIYLCYLQLVNLYCLCSDTHTIQLESVQLRRHSHGLAIGICPSVGLSVRLSNACTLIKRNLSSLTGCGSSLQLGADTVTAQDDVRLLGVTISSDLCLQRHVSNVSAKSFYWLRQIRRVRRSLDPETSAMQYWLEPQSQSPTHCSAL